MAAPSLESPSDLALLRGLRRRGDEVQLSRVVAEVARSDCRFASEFASVVLAAARRDGNTEHVDRMQMLPVPEELRCTRESGLYDLDESRGLGRVDLRFKADGFTLFVENKLGSGYGETQVDRYLRALRLLPSHVPRRGLVALTRDVPGYGEREAEEDEAWLGSVRWARIAGELRAIRPQDPQVAAQWRLLLDLLDEQGDLGMTSVDRDLIRSWGKFRRGRDLVQQLLANIQGRTETLLSDALTERYPALLSKALISPYRRGKQDQISVVRGGLAVWFGFRVPASMDRATVIIQFTNQWGEAHFTVEAWPFASESILRSTEFKKACERLDADEFAVDPRLRYLAKVHGPDSYFGEDVPARLLGIVEDDLKTLVGSGLFDSLVTPGGLRSG